VTLVHGYEQDKEISFLSRELYVGNILPCNLLHANECTVIL